MKTTFSNALLLAAASALVLGSINSVQAQSATWTGGGSDGLWSNAANWTGTPGSGGTLTFNAAGAGALTNDLAAGTSFSLSFGTSGGSGSYTINGNSISLGATSISGASTGTQTFNVDLILSANRSIGTTGSGAHLQFNGNLLETPGAKNVNFTGASTKTLLGSNTWSGLTTIQSGTVTINSIANAGINSALGAGSSVLLGSNNNLGRLTLDAVSAMSTNKEFIIGGTNATTTADGTIRNNSTGAANTLTLSGSITGSSNAAYSGISAVRFGGTNTGANTASGIISNAATGSVAVEKIESGRWIVTGSNTYTGGTLVSAGTLLVNNESGSGTGTGAVSVASGGIIGGSGTIGGSLALASGAFFAFDAAYTLTVFGMLTLDSSFGVANLRNTSGGAIDWSSVANNTYTLINTSFVFNETNISNFGLANAFDIGGGRSAYFTNGSLALVVIPEPSTMGLFGIAVTSLLAIRRRRK